MKEGGVLNLCQMFGGRLLLGNQNPEAECSSVSSNERQEQSCKKHTLQKWRWISDTEHIHRASCAVSSVLISIGL